MTKYKAIPTVVDGIRFASKKEAGRYVELKQLMAAGEVTEIELQPCFELPGGIKYYADFRITYADGRVVVEDVKGYKTAVYKLKKKMVEDLYAPIKIVEV